MKKKKRGAEKKQWLDGDPPPKTHDPVVQTVHVEGVTYQRRFTKCGKDRCRKGCASGRASHGPYWYAVHWIAPKGTKAMLAGEKGRTKTVYVGKELPRLETLADRPEMKS